VRREKWKSWWTEIKSRAEVILAPLLTLSLPAMALLPSSSPTSGFVGLGVYIRVQDTLSFLPLSFSGSTLWQLFTSEFCAIVRVHQPLAKDEEKKMCIFCAKNLGNKKTTCHAIISTIN